MTNSEGLDKLEGDASPRERYMARYEELNTKGRLALSRLEEIYRRLDSSNGIDLTINFARAREETAKFTTDSNWVDALRDAGVDPRLILRVWDKKDEYARGQKGQTMQIPPK